MAKVSRDATEVNARIVYWGCEGAGKSANLRAAFARLRPDHRGEIKQVPTRIDPTVGYELLPITLGKIAGTRTQIEMVAVPGVWNSGAWMVRRSIVHPPGTHFEYDDQGTNLIAIILRRAVGGNIAEFARNELFAPLQIDRYQWMVDGEGNLPGYAGLRLTGRDMAKIGLLYLQRGRWRERQVVSEAWVLDSTRKHNDGGEPASASYGYLWWTKTTRDGLLAYFAAGYQSQLILNFPDRNLVIALASSATIPGGTGAFINDVVLYAEAALPAGAACIARLDQ